MQRVKPEVSLTWQTHYKIGGLAVANCTDALALGYSPEP